MDLEVKLKEKSLAYTSSLEKFKLNFEQNIQDFLWSEFVKCLILETRDTKTAAWRTEEVFKEIQEKLSTKYKATIEHYLLKWNDLINITSSFNLLPTFPKCVIIEITDEEDLKGNCSNILEKCLYRLNLSNWRKVIFIISQMDMLDTFLQRMTRGGIVKLNEFEDKSVCIFSGYKKEPLLRAAASGDLKAVRELIKCGADINQLCINTGNTALHLASDQGHTDVVLILICNHATITTNNRGETPLQLAATLGHEDIVVALLENGANVDSTDAFGWTSLIQAAKKGYYGVVVTLIEYGADVNIQNDGGSSALHVAAENGHYVIVYTLLKNKAEVNCIDCSNNTPLHYAASSGYSDIVKILLSVNAWIDPLNSDGQTPLDLAKEFGHNETLQQLKDSLDERSVLRQAINIIKRRSSIKIKN